MKIMRKIACLLFLATAMVVASCSDDIAIGGSDNGNTMNYKMQVGIPLYQTVSSRAGAADPDGDQIKTMYLLCFDENGYYLGKSKATISNAVNTTAAITGDISGNDVPSNTARIHFIANANVTNIDDDHYKGVSENVMIPSLYSGYGVVNFWGYKRCSSSSEMKTFLQNSSTNTVTLYRNQAQIAAVDASGTSSYTINGIAVCNVNAFGTVAMCDRTKLDSDPFSTAFADGIVSSLSDDKNVKADDPTDVTSYANYNIFESTNMTSDYLIAIVKVNGKYHKILIEDANYDFYTIHRNHQYKINIKGLSEDGYTSFEAAKKGVAANNPLITIDDVIPSWDYGNYSLTITDGTSQIFNSAGAQTIGFVFKHKDGTTASSSELTALWGTNNGIAASNISISSYNATTGVGTITITLNSTSSTLQQGTVYLKINGTPVQKPIYIYSISAFQFSPVYLTQKAADAIEQEMVVDFTIPDNFPVSLLPLKIKIVTNRYDGISTKSNLAVITETTAGQDWNYKYVYTATKTGPHRVYLKTIDNGYATANGGTGSKNTLVYLEAENFSRTSSNFSYNSTTDKKITLSSSESGTYSSNDLSFTGLNPLKGQPLAIYYKLETTSDLYVYTNKFTMNSSDFTEVTSKYTGVRCYMKTNTSSGHVNLVSNTTNFGENIWFESSNNKSACALVQANSSAGAITVSTTKPAYGIGGAVAMSLAFPSYGTGVAYTIYTKDLTAVAGQAGLTALPGGSGYTYVPTSATATLNFTTKYLVNREAITVSVDQNTLVATNGTCQLENNPITGTLTIAENFSSSPFIYIDDADYNRVGSITVNSVSGTTCSYTLALRSYYNLDTMKEVTIHAGDYKKMTTIGALLSNANLTLTK